MAYTPNKNQPDTMNVHDLRTYLSNFPGNALVFIETNSGPVQLSGGTPGEIKDGGPIILLYGMQKTQVSS